jgi:hypothetical protein
MMDIEVMATTAAEAKALLQAEAELMAPRGNSGRHADQLTSPHRW